MRKSELEQHDIQTTPTRAATNTTVPNLPRLTNTTMSDQKCTCLYKALLTNKSNFCKEDARTKYKELVNKAEKLPSDIKTKVIRLLDQAKNILGDLSLERMYNNNGFFSEEHNCDTTQETLDTIKGLQHAESGTGEGQSNSQVNCNSNDKTTEAVSTEQEAHDTIIHIEDITNHRFRKDQLKFNVLVNPGHITIVEDEEKITKTNQNKVTEYLKALKRNHPRRLTHIIRKKPHLIKLLNGTTA